MNIVVLTALLSVGNSGLYAATRMLWAMAQEGMISKKLSYVNARGVRCACFTLTMMFAMLSLLTAFFAEDTVFIWLLSLAGLGSSRLDFHLCFSARVSSSVRPKRTRCIRTEIQDHSIRCYH